MRVQLTVCLLTCLATLGPRTLARGERVAMRSIFAYDAYYHQGDEFLTPTPAPAATAMETSAGCDVGCSEPTCCDMIDPCCGNSCSSGAAACQGGICGAVERLSLADALGLEDSAYLIGGWTNFAYYDNNVPLSQAKDDLLSFDDVPDRMNLAQQWFYLERTVDGAVGLDVGGRIDLVYGTDAQKTQAFGNPGASMRGFGSWDASLDHGYYGWAIPQAYAEVASGDLAVKLGHFFTPIGYEVIPATGNFFHSHSYTMFNSEPFTHTGALATYTGREALTLYGGWTAGWDTGFDNFAGGSNFLGGFAAELSDAITFTYINTYGNFGWRDGGSKDSYSHSCVLSAALTNSLQYIAQSDYLRTDNPGVSQFDTVGLNQYVIYQINDAVSAGGRMEWWKADGVSYYEATGGVNIHVLDNLVCRPEMRKDWAPGNPDIDEDTAAVDMILTF